MGTNKPEYMHSWRERNKNKVVGYEKKRYEKRKYSKYGITKEILNQILLEQNNKCYICNTEFTESVKLNIDHCHTTMKVRGLLCINCNLGVGHFKDNIELLDNAIKYIIKSKL
jgi:nitrate/TMAO reductase-like tetraheme cytochrome c subunit